MKAGTRREAKTASGDGRWGSTLSGNPQRRRRGGARKHSPAVGRSCLLFDVVLEKQSGKGSSVKIEQVSVTHVRSSVGVTESCTEYISPNPHQKFTCFVNIERYMLT